MVMYVSVNVNTSSELLIIEGGDDREAALTLRLMGRDIALVV